MDHDDESSLGHEVVWLVRAQRALTAVVLTIAEDNPTAALAVKERIERATGHLAAHPELGRQGRIDGTRELVIAGLPYLIPYRVRYGRVEILDVIHSARRWPSHL